MINNRLNKDIRDHIVSELLPKESKPAAKLPMVPVSELNSEIGLPSGVVA